MAPPETPPDIMSLQQIDENSGRSKSVTAIEDPTDNMLKSSSNNFDDADGEGTEMILLEENLPSHQSSQSVKALGVLKEVLAIVKMKKEEGNAHFSNRNYDSAAQIYLEAIHSLESCGSDIDSSTDTTIEKEIRELQVATRNNLAAVFLKLREYAEADRMCTSIIDSWDDSVAKVWFRRGCARECLAEKLVSKGTLDYAEKVMEWAREDLSKSVRLCQKQPQSKTNDSEKQGAIQAWTRVQNKFQKMKQQVKNQKRNDVPEPQTPHEPPLSIVGLPVRKTPTPPRPPPLTNRNPPSDAGEYINGNGSAIPQPILDEPEELIVQIPSPAQQRNDVMKLLIGRSVSLEKKGIVEGEALFLVDWKWWCQWCRYVDFFQQQLNGSGDANENSRELTRKAQRVLRLLPSGAVFPAMLRPSKNKKNSDNNRSRHSQSGNGGDDEDNTSSTVSSGNSASSDDSSIGLDDSPPGALDNSALLLLPLSRNKNCIGKTVDQFSKTQSAFYKDWYRHFESKSLVAETSSIQSADSPSVSNNAESDSAAEFTAKASTISLRPNLVRGIHYEIVPREVYCALKSWYREMTPSICRRITVVNVGGGESKSVASIQLYPLSNPGDSTSLSSRCSSCRAKFASKRCSRCNSAVYCERSCQESHWPFHKATCQKIVNAKRDNSGDNVDLSSVAHAGADGRVGLRNMGNTCFMASALQCLSHATPLTRFFLSNQFKLDLNVSNPLGTGGKLAYAYESTLKELWLKPNISSTTPTALKRAIALVAPRFAGCLQHDSQEFLAFFLDALNEDLNRIRKPPYVEMPDADNCTNMIVAGAEAWECHLRRNDSLVMDTFYGQFKSTCVCPNPNCGRVSVSFDSFNHVSLEIPQMQKTTMWVPVFVCPSPNKSKTPLWMRYMFCIRRGGIIEDLKRSLAREMEVPMTHLIMCRVNGQVIQEVLHDNYPISRHNDGAIAAYQISPSSECHFHAVVLQTLLYTPSLPGDVGEEQSEMEATQELFGHPFMTTIDPGWTCQQVWLYLWKHVRHMVLPLTEEGEGEVSPEVEGMFQQLLSIRLIDQHRNAISVFPAACTEAAELAVQDDEGEENINARFTSELPKKGKQKIGDFLENFQERILFVSLDWLETIDIPMEKIELADDRNNIQNDFGQNPGKKKKKNTKAKKCTIIPETVGINPRRFVFIAEHETAIEGRRKQEEMNGSRGVSLNQCFEAFTKPERLDEHNKWYCSNCKQHVRALKTMELWRLPNILVVHLKRFEFRHGYRRDKLTTFVDFPLEGLDMSKHCPDRELRDNEEALPKSLYVDDGVPAVYDLFAVVNHFGRMGFGHYTAFCRKWDEDSISREWALFDDSSVRSVEDEVVVSPAAYVLFYRRRTFN